MEKAGKLLTAKGAALKKLYDECEDRDSLNSLSEKIELLKVFLLSPKQPPPVS